MNAKFDLNTMFNTTAVSANCLCFQVKAHNVVYCHQRLFWLAFEVNRDSSLTFVCNKSSLVKFTFIVNRVVFYNLILKYVECLWTFVWIKRIVNYGYYLKKMMVHAIRIQVKSFWKQKIFTF